MFDAKQIMLEEFENSETLKPCTWGQGATEVIEGPKRQENLQRQPCTSNYHKGLQISLYIFIYV